MSSVAVVTGAASGIGRAITQRLHGDGWSVVAADRDPRHSPGLTTSMTPALATVVCDVTTEEGNESIVATALDRFGRIDGVALNAGVGSLGRDRHAVDERVRSRARREPARRRPRYSPRASGAARCRWFRCRDRVDLRLGWRPWAVGVQRVEGRRGQPRPVRRHRAGTRGHPRQRRVPRWHRPDRDDGPDGGARPSSSRRCDRTSRCSAGVEPTKWRAWSRSCSRKTPRS